MFNLQAPVRCAERTEKLIVLSKTYAQLNSGYLYIYFMKPLCLFFIYYYSFLDKHSTYAIIDGIMLTISIDK